MAYHAHLQRTGDENPIPPGSDQGSAGGAGAGGDRQLASDLPGSRATAASRGAPPRQPRRRRHGRRWRLQFDYLNAQEQRQIVWPPSFAKARAYLDQLERQNSLAPTRVTAVRAELAAAEKLSGQARQQALVKLGAQLSLDAEGAADPAKARLLSAAVSELVSVR
jgi:hypothetical protein